MYYFDTGVLTINCAGSQLNLPSFKTNYTIWEKLKHYFATMFWSSKTVTIENSCSGVTIGCGSVGHVLPVPLLGGEPN